MPTAAADFAAGNSSDTTGLDVEHGHGASGGLFIFIAFFLGLFCKNVLSRTKLPYTVILLLFGMIVGAIHASTSFVAARVGQGAAERPVTQHASAAWAT